MYAINQSKIELPQEFQPTAVPEGNNTTIFQLHCPKSDRRIKGYVQAEIIVS